MTLSPIWSLSLFAGGLCFVAWTVWFIVKIYKKQTLLPTLEVLNLKKTIKSKKTFKNPPWIPFFIFVLLSAIFLFSSLGPHRLILDPATDEDPKSLMIIDLSPSMQGHLSEEDLKSFILENVEKYFLGSYPDLLLSNQLDVIKVGAKRDFLNVLSRLKYHRAGFRLSSLITEKSVEVFSYDRLFIVSDGDDHTWKDLNLDLLQLETNFFHLDVRQAEESAVNYFIHSTERLDSESGKIVSFRVNIGRSDTEEISTGSISLTLSSREISQHPFEFVPGAEQASVIVSIDRTTIEQNQEGALEGVLEIDLGPVGAEKLLLDNKYFTPLNTGLGRALITGDPLGEQYLEDPLRQLSVALKVNGIRVVRSDSGNFKVSGSEDEFGETYAPVDSFLAQSFDFVAMQVSSHDKESCQNLATLPPSKMNWFLALEPERDVYALCECVAENVTETELKCSEVVDATSFVDQFELAGFVPAGGFVSQLGYSPFYQFVGKEKVYLVSLVAMDPRAAGDISHSNLPLVVSRLLDVGGKLTGGSSQEENGGEDITEYLKRTVSQTSNGQSAENAFLYEDPKNVNVPVGESLENKVSEKTTFNSAATDLESSKSTLGASTQKDSTRIRLTLVILTALLIAAELLYFVIRRKRESYG